MNSRIQLNATGETVTFTKTSADTNGEYLEVLVTLQSDREGPPPHRHVLQSEHFEVIEGTAEVMCNKEKVLLEPGQSFTVPANTLHAFHSANGTDIKLKVTLTPALNFQYILTEVFDSCNRRKSMQPSVFDATYVLNQARGEYLLGGVPMAIQKYVFPIIAIIGKTFGLVKASSLSTFRQLKFNLSV